MKDPANIVVLRKRDGDLFEFDVMVKDMQGESRHAVTLSRATYEQLTASKYAPETCVEASFRFLLDRESKDSILQNFDVAVISQYFPDFEHELPNYLSNT
ncbi:MAG TPA: hypothetical protein VKF35_20920 [Hyphomicrobiaceae bacterium]|nr:hypothetical protein [Hyphomicrobiaceae bacterium]